MAQSAQPNRKKIMAPTTMSKSGWALIEARDDLEGVEFAPNLPKAEFHKMLEDVSGICLGVNVRTLVQKMRITPPSPRPIRSTKISTKALVRFFRSAGRGT